MQLLTGTTWIWIPAAAEGTDGKDEGGEGLLGTSDGSWRAWDCVSCRRCIKVLLERENARKKKGTKYHLGVPGMEYAEDRNPDHSETQTLSLRPALYPWL